MNEDAAVSKNYKQELFLYLKEDFQKKQLRNSNFSLRAYARYLQISPAVLSRILSGKRKISKQCAEQILARITLQDPSLGQHLRQNVNMQDKVSGDAYSELDVLKIDILSEWFYFGVLSLSETQDFQDNPSWISNRLGISAGQAKMALKNLERLDLLRRNKQGRLVCTCVQLSTSDRVVNLSVRRLNHQSLDLAKSALDNLDAQNLSQSSYSGITMAIDPNLLPEAHKKITAFRRKLCAFLEGGQQKEVYRLGLQLFPLSQTAGPKKKPSPAK